MKRNRFIVIAIVAVSLLATAVGAVRLCRYYLPQEGPACALFERYKDNPCVKASLLRDFQVNDTLATDALLLEAATDSAWCELMADFGTPEEMIELYKSDKEFFVGEDVNAITFYYIDRNNPKERVSLKKTGSRLVIFSHQKKSLSVFLTEDNNVRTTIELSKIVNLKNKKQ